MPLGLSPNLSLTGRDDRSNRTARTKPEGDNTDLLAAKVAPQVCGGGAFGALRRVPGWRQLSA